MNTPLLVDHLGERFYILCPVAISIRPCSPEPASVSASNQSMWGSWHLSLKWKKKRAFWLCFSSASAMFCIAACDCVQRSLQRRPNERDGVSNRQCPHCLLNRLIRRRPKKTSNPRATGLCEGIPPVTGGFLSQRASNAENVSIWWRHHVGS